MAPKDVGEFAIFPVTADTPVPLMIVGVLLTLGGHTWPLTAGLNAGIERVAYRPLRHAPKLAPPHLRDRPQLRAGERLRVIFAGDDLQRTVEAVFPTNNLLEAFGIASVQPYGVTQVFVGVVTAPAAVRAEAGSWARTKQGRAMRATTQVADAAGLMV